MRSKLEIPLYSARLRIECKHAAGVQICAFPDRSIKIGSRIANGPENGVGFGVIGSSHPGRATAELGRIAGPSRSRRISFSRNRPLPPKLLSRGGVVGIHEAL